MPDLPLSDEVVSFIEEHKALSPDQAAVKARKLGLPHLFIADQIKSYQKIKNKVSDWSIVKGLILPESRYLEQASSVDTAKFKASIVKGNCFADLTGGSGVDTWAFAKNFESGHYLEPNDYLVSLARHNFQALGLSNIKCHVSNAGEWESLSPVPDLLYLDPSRRDPSDGRRFYGLENYLPDPREIVVNALQKGVNVVLKLSPMDSIPELLSFFPMCAEVYVLALKRECKELLLVFKPNLARGNILYHAVELQSPNGFHIQYDPNSIDDIPLKTSEPLQYIYDLHPALMKLGAYAWPLQLDGVFKLHPNTHLYTSEKLIHEFPGRTFILENVILPKASEIFKLIPEKKAMLLTRNYPEQTEKLLKKWKIQEGGTKYLAACTLSDNKHKVLVLSRLLKELA